MRAGRPRSRGCRPDGEVEGIRRATSQKADLHPLGNSRLPASPAPAPHDGADHSRPRPPRRGESETGFVSDKRLMTWLHLLNDCAEINKMLNVPIQKLSTIHYPLSPAPAPDGADDGADHFERAPSETAAAPPHAAGRIAG